MTISCDLKKRILIAHKFKKHKGYSVKHILDMYKISNGSLYNWISKQGSLFTKTIRRTKITAPIKCYIRAYVIRNVNFNRYKLIKLIKKNYNVLISVSSIYNILKQMNVTKKKIYKRNKFSSVQKFKRAINEFKNKIANIDINNIISIDETSIDTHICHNYGWSKKGAIIVKTNTKQRIRYTVICAITNKNILHTQIIKGSCNGEQFKNFIIDVINKLSKKRKHYFLLDNAKIHHYTKLKEFINGKTFTEFIYNVPYMPEFNPIEFVFNEVKHTLKKNNITNLNILKNINKAFKNVNKYNLLKYYKNSLVTNLNKCDI